VSIRPEVPAKSLTEMGRERLRALAAEYGQPRYRADQLFKWLFGRGVRDLDAMTDLPKGWRQQLRDDGYTIGRVTLDKTRESVDGTRKLAFRLEDRAVVESVLIPMGDGHFTQCVSSQVGCALACAFCYTGTLGLSRHLTPGEILDQVLLARDNAPPGGQIDHIVYMGMGEPLHNFEGVVESIRRITDPDGVGFSPKRVTVSTAGLVPMIEKLGQTLPVNLAVSLNATTDEVRDRIMPVNKKYGIEKLVEALRNYPQAFRRKMTVEYVLLGGVNDTDDDARRLARLLKGLPVRINLLPWNPFSGPGFARPEDGRVRSFQDILQRAGHTVTVRTTKGLDIDAACGQLGERPAA
jgi:23S rRNA (adenine2503-C2)-methyltransferase